MMARIATVALTCVVVTTLSAQEPTFVVVDTTAAGNVRLCGPVELTRPTIIILVKVPKGWGCLKT
jgi:hypothetical protein